MGVAPADPPTGVLRTFTHAQTKISMELNEYKKKEMQVHEASSENTQIHGI